MGMAQLSSADCLVKHLKSVHSVLLLLSVFLVSLLAVRSIAEPNTSYLLRLPAVPEIRSTKGWTEGGRELVLVYIGSPSCAYSNAPELPNLVTRAAASVKSRASAVGASFATIGVSPSSSVARGLQHLEKIGTFDEIAVGRAWYNTSLLRFVYGNLPGPAATPQLIVLARRGGAGPTPNLRTERVLLRFVGTASIRRWLALGTPIPVAGWFDGN